MLDDKDFKAILPHFFGNFFVDTHYHEGDLDSSISDKLTNTIGSILYCLDRFNTIMTVEPDDELIKCCKDLLGYYPVEVLFMPSFEELYNQVPKNMGSGVFYLKSQSELNKCVEIIHCPNVLFILDQNNEISIPEGYEVNVVNNKLYISLAK
jgi:hypothetical protein